MEVLFIKFNYADMLNQYLTNIFMLKCNLNILYFNIVGEFSLFYKKRILNDLKEINKFYLKLGNLIKKIGGYPITNLEEIKSISTLKELSSKDYTANEAFNILFNDFNIINNMNNQVFKYAMKKYDVSSINLVLEFNNYLERRVGVKAK